MNQLTTGGATLPHDIPPFRCDPISWLVTFGHCGVRPMWTSALYQENEKMCSVMDSGTPKREDEWVVTGNLLSDECWFSRT
eukprot:s1480_g19.t1